MPLTLTLNGQSRSFPLDDVISDPTLAHIVGELGLRADRIAVELNGLIIPKGAWTSTPVASGDRLELVHFVGGGIELHRRNYSAARLDRA